MTLRMFWCVSLFVFEFLSLAGLTGMVQAGTAGSESAVDFQRKVRPILSDNCFHCHGPDPNTRLADLRLDTREGVFQARPAGSPVVPGNAKASLVYQRISDPDPARRMPPAFSHKTLSQDQIEIIRQWIDQGAQWQEHWAFTAPKRPELPAVKVLGWVRNPIDRFILAKLEAAGLQPAPEADRRTLLRRLSLDLTGLPPTPAEVEAFLNDSSADAYEKQVDRLLNSEHWGEHRARYWLDAARYADTHGIHVDNYREMWPYRDWVINAFNRNLSFDRFTIEQLAGDLLPNRTMDQQIASGFHRCNVTTNEGGVIVEEVEAMYAKDRVDTTGAVWLGLTVGCATCHDHKFDPISTKDFYSLTAFFRNTTQQAMDGNIPGPPPIIVVPRTEDRARWAQLQREETDLRQRMDQKHKNPERPFEKWLGSARHQTLATPLDAESEVMWLSLGQSIELHRAGAIRSLELPSGITVGTGPSANSPALQFEANAGLALTSDQVLDADRAFSVSFWVYQPSREDNFVVASQSDLEDKNRGWSIELGARILSFQMTGNEGKAIRVVAGFTEQFKPGSWNHVVVTYDGSREEKGLALFLNGKTAPTQVGGEMVARIEGSIAVKSPLTLGGNGKRFFQGGAISDFRVFGRVISQEEASLASLWPAMEAARTKEAKQLSDAEREALHLHFLNYHDSGYIKLTSQLRAVLKQRDQIRERGSVTHVMEEKTETQPMAHVLYRGQYDQPRDAVEPNVPSVLPPMAASLPRNRLGLAEWLMDPSNPLTARVTVNRFWQEVFGNGIVKTTEDFGSQGEPPSHPELLDWLAVEFRESGWDIKKFFRLFVTSATYRQSALTSEEKLKADPENRLLSRGPRFRMDAEMVRDYALAASGLLVPRLGGPSVKPYQPNGIWEAVAMLGSNTRFYHQDSGEKLYRRSLYTFWKRSAPPASMDIFNAPTRETCTVRRERTNTPLQALVTMNGPQFVEAARHLAQRALEERGSDFERQLDFVSARLLARPLDSREREVVRKAYDDFRRHYASHPEDASQLLTVGESKADTHLASADFAALTMVTNQMMNLDEVLNK
ncbi:MAG: DUF1553 domain-containing protein [Acidobacteriota bacterium]